MRSHHEMVVIPLKQMSEDNQQLIWLKHKVAKEQRHSKALEESFGIVSEKLRQTMEENRIVRQRTKWQHEEYREEMDSQEAFYKDQMKVIHEARDARDDKFEMEQQEKREKVKQLNAYPSINEDAKAREHKIQEFIKSQESEMEEFVAERDRLGKLIEARKVEMKKRHWEEEMELEKDYDAELSALMEKYTPKAAPGNVGRGNRNTTGCAWPVPPVGRSTGRGTGRQQPPNQIQPNNYRAPTAVQAPLKSGCNWVPVASSDKTKLKFDMKSHHEMVVIPFKQMGEDNQQLIWLKHKIAKEQRQLKALEESFVSLSEKLRQTMEENRIVRQRIKWQHEEYREEMDSQEAFYKEQMKIIHVARDAREDMFEMEQQEKREKVKQLNGDPSINEDSKARERKIQEFIESQDSEMQEFEAERDRLGKLFEARKVEIWELEMKLEKDYDAELSALMEKYTPKVDNTA
ncbi:hypothetical protein QQ045_010717 [Rhodiola kirilowii]